MKMEYVFRMALLSVIRNKYITIIQIVCFMFGIIIPFFFVSQFNREYENVKLNGEALLTNSMIMIKPKYSNDALPIKKEDLDDIIDINKNWKAHYLNSNYYSEILIHNKIVIGYSVYYTDEDICNIFNNKFIANDNLNLDTEKCIVGKEISDKMDLMIGDIISVDGYNCKVIAINNIPMYSTSIFIPQSLFKDDELYDATYFFKVDGDINLEKDKLSDIVNKYYGEYDFFCEDEINQLYLSKVLSGWGITILISIISLIYCMVNVYNIMYFYSIKMKKKNTICLALGARKSHIFIQKYIEIGSILFISSLLCFGILCFLERSWIKYYLSIKVDLSILLIILLFDQIVAIVFTLLLMWKFIVNSITTNLKGNV